MRNDPGVRPKFSQCLQSVEVILERDPRDRENPTRKFDRWIVWFRGDLLVEGVRDPEPDACRELLDMGITGKVTFRHKGSLHPSMFMDIEKAAQWSIHEDGNGFHRRRYKAYHSGSGSPKTHEKRSNLPIGTPEAKSASTERNDGGAS